MENLSESIKLPSNWSLVNPESIWRHLGTIANTGYTFNKEQLIKNGLYTNNEDNISRNLSYLKYLGLIDEERSKGKDQRFKVIDNKNVKDIFYELKAGRDEGARTKFKLLLQHHSLYITVRDQFFAGDNNKTLNDLEHFLKDGVPGKAPQYYQKGGEFLMKLLSLASLIKLNGNDITLISDDSKLSHNDAPKEVDQKGKVADEIPAKVHAQEINAYVVKISSPNINVEVSIKKIAHLILIESLLQTLKMEIEENLNKE